MAFASLISLKHTIQTTFLVNSPHVQETLQSAYNLIKPLQQVVESLETTTTASKKADAMVANIRETTHQLEDVLESSQIQSEPESAHLRIKEDIDLFIQTMEQIIGECSTPAGDEDGDEQQQEVIPPRVDVYGMRQEMIGVEDEFAWVRKLLDHDDPDCKRALSLVGMAGIGKTSLAMKVLEDPVISRGFGSRVFVSIGPNCPAEKILLRILPQLGYEMEQLHGKTFYMLAKRLCWRLYNKRYLIILDDMWSTQVWERLRYFFPENNNGSRVLITTRLEEVAQYVDRNTVHRLRFLNDQESWDLLCREVFPKDQRCPIELEKAGKEIAENCEGLPLAIITVAKYLSKMDKTPECWMKAADRQNSVFADAEEEMSKVLFPSYKYLPSYLKPCFLYMGVFPRKCKIYASKLFKLWNAEGLLEPTEGITFENFAMHCLEMLVSKSLIRLDNGSTKNRIKTCSLHFAFVYLSVREAEQNQFLHIINGREKKFAQAIEKQRRLCIQKNALLGMKDVHATMRSVPTARSLLCTGPYHQYEVPVCFGLWLLRVLDALSIRFYEFPSEVLKLIRLRYLALTCNRNVPDSISNLNNLQCLIIGQHLRIKANGPSVLLPKQIWDMSELKHLHLSGGDLPECASTALATSLSTLTGISEYSCTKGVLGRIMNLKKLGIQVVLMPDSAKHMPCFDHLSHLHQLESLKCVIVNPNPRIEAIPRPTSASSFPACLKKLTLSGLGYPWKVMNTIGSLPSLQVLKLRCYAFRGPQWSTPHKGFLQLQYLQIEDTDLKHWKVQRDAFPLLQRLIIRHCYKLEAIPEQFADQLQKLELVACNPLADDCAKRMPVFWHSMDISIRTWQDEEDLKK